MRIVDGGMPVVTVVITCWNHGRFLRDAVDSVWRQTFTNLELIVVDDGSTDDTPAVAASLPGIRYIRQSHAGLSAARNAGWRAARGRHLLFLDADDRLLPPALRVGVESSETHPEAAFVSGHYVVIDAAGRQVSDRHRPCVVSDHYPALLRANYIGMHATVLYRRETLERYGGFDESLPAGEDYDLFLRVARQASILCHPAVVAEYRWHGANMSLNSELMLRTTLRVLGRQREHLRGDAGLEEAYQEGVVFWQRLYGDPLLEELVTRLRAGRSWRVAAHLLVVLLRYYPRGLVRLAGRFTKRLIGHHVWLR
jgi:glycosyltransferase involved in cell wall biosynthesis